MREMTDTEIGGGGEVFSRPATPTGTGRAAVVSAAAAAGAATVESEDEAGSPSASSLLSAAIVAATAAGGGLPGAASEDGYLGDCSSDGGNEKNFPIPPDYKYHQSAAAKCPMSHEFEDAIPGAGTAAAATAAAGSHGAIEAPAGLAFQNLRQSTSLSSIIASKSSKFQLGYQVISTRNLIYHVC